MCQQYLVDEEMPLDHMDLEHPTVAPEPVVVKSQVTEDPAILEADRQDSQVKCKYCDRHFKNVAECNMHVNRRHKKVGCPQCAKRHKNQIDADQRTPLLQYTNQGGHSTWYPRYLCLTIHQPPMSDLVQVSKTTKFIS